MLVMKEATVVQNVKSKKGSVGCIMRQLCEYEDLLKVGIIDPTKGNPLCLYKFIKYRKSIADH
jgi:hypothetical protein